MLSLFPFENNRSELEEEVFEAIGGAVGVAVVGGWMFVVLGTRKQSMRICLVGGSISQHSNQYCLTSRFSKCPQTEILMCVCTVHRCTYESKSSRAPLKF